MKSIAIQFCFILFVIGTKAQTPNWAWAKSSQGSAPATALCAYKNNQILVIGQYNNAVSFGSTTLTSNGGADAYIANYDAQGNLLWANTAGGVLGDNSNCITADSSGNFYILGNFQGSSISFGTLTATSSNTGSSLYVTKYNVSGNAVWSKTSSGTNNVIGMSIFSDANGNTFIAGSFIGTLVLGTFTLTSADQGSEVFYAKLNTLGNVLWAKSLNAVGVQEGFGISVDLDGDVYLLGTFSSSFNVVGNFTLTNTLGTYDTFVAKCDVFGNVLWAKGLDAVFSYPYPNNITTDQNGNCYVTGYYNGSMTLGTVTLSPGSSMGTMFLVKYDPSGNVVWAKAESGAMLSRGTGLVTDHAGNCYVTGVYNSSAATFGTVNIASSGFSGVFVVKYDASGNAIWAQTAGAGSLNFTKGIKMDSNGDLLVAGYYDFPSFICGTSTLSTNVQSTMFVAKLNGLAVGLTQEEAWAPEIKVYPNPASSEISLSKLGQYKKLSIRILDLNGKLVLTKTLKEQEPKTINISSLTPALYFLEVENESQHLVRKKFLKE